MGSALAAAIRAALVAGVVTAVGCREQPAERTGGPPAPRPGGEIVASLRSEPGNYNRYFEASAAADLVTMLTQARLVRINRATDALEPALAESWSTSDSLTYRVKLRPNVRFSDGAPFSSADVVFSLQAVYAPGSTLGSGMRVGGQPLSATAIDETTVDITFPRAFAPAMRLLDNLPILPRHRLQGAYDAKAMKDAWTPSRPVSEVAGLGPFLLSEHVSGQRLVFTRNPNYWRKDTNGASLPYADRLTVVIIPDQRAEALRLESGATDVMSNADIQPADHARFRRLHEEGRLQLLDGGIGLDPNVLWFNLKSPRPEIRAWVEQKAFRQAVSYAADRQAIVDTVYLGGAVPVHGPVTPRNATWFSSAAPAYPHDPRRARDLLASLGLRDANGDGMLDDRQGRPVRFSILVQAGHAIRERTASVLQQQLRAVGIGIDLVALEGGAIGQRWMKGEYDSIFHGWQVSATDPAMTLDFWLSGSPQHFWNPSQSSPATEWERRMDELMLRQASAGSLAERQRLFAEVQRIFGEELPAIYFVAPKVTIATSRRVQNLQPAPQLPQLLWAADSIAVSGPAPRQ